MLLVELAAAWVGTGAFWDWQVHPIEDPFRIDAATFPAGVGDTGAIDEALTTNMEAWSAAGADVSLTPADTGAYTLYPDGHFSIGYEDIYVGGGTLAFAGTWSWDDGGAFDCDIVYLASNDYGAVTWSAGPDVPTDSRIDVRAVGLHELGHCLGLGHSDDGSAVMYAYYTGVRTLQPDDVTGVLALHGTPCGDGDGDGQAVCDGDCADDNALVHTGATESCNGVDDDCDGVVDDRSEVSIDVGGRATSAALDYQAAGNVVTPLAPTALLRFRARVTVDPGTRLVWAVHSSADGGTTWALVRSARTEATADTYQQSPDLDVAMVPGTAYAATVGGLGGFAAAYDGTPDLATVGVLTPLGGVSGRALADDLGAVQTTYLCDQQWDVVDLPDPDGDGQTATCGDCAPTDPTQAGTLPELCNGLDDDCDTLVDEDFASDTDMDGVIDCLDVCPHDALDTCDDPVDTAPVDSAPEDSADTDVAKPEPAAACGCASGGTSTGWLGLMGIVPIVGIVAARRRRTKWIRVGV